ncbi:MAG TPA: TonB-dependent receptor [Chitinophagales bacterium]|nr:TonB-dependent receptor [Chitinophagales bacterium]
MSARLLSLILTFFILSSSVSAQSASITGTITDADNGEPLIGATVAVQNTSQGSVTDLDGKYSIGNLPSGTYTLKTSYIGYIGKEISGVEVKNGQVTTMNITMSVTKTNTLIEVVVTAEARKENIASLLVARKNSAVVSDAISADMIRRSPDKNTSDVLKRVSGVTIVDNKFVVVRGMSDRYNSAMLNNCILPSSEPDKKAFAFDIFPAAIVDNITIVKSATPELPGDFSGGLVQINTKEIPDKNFISVKVGESYNSISTFNSYQTYQGGKTDWLGFDDGTRSLPGGFPSHAEFLTLGDGGQVAAGKTLLNTWAYHRVNSTPLNPSLQIAAGFKSGAVNYPQVGGTFAITYNDTRKFNPQNRYDYYGQPQETSDTIYKYHDTIYSRNVLTSVLADFAFKLNANNKLFINSLFSTNSNDYTAIRSGYSFSQGEYVKANAFYYASNQIFFSQFGGEHVIEKAGKLKIRWQYYYTLLTRDEPDYRRNLYYTDDLNNPYFAVLSSSPSTNIGAGLRYYGKIDDRAKGANADLSLPFKLFKQTQTLRFGGAYYYDVRSRDVRVLSAIIADPGNFNFNYYYADQDTIYAPDHFNNSTGFTLAEDNTPTNHYDGSVENSDGYIMLDNKFSDKIRFVWGVRYENYHYILNTFDTNNDSLRLDSTYRDFLPSGNLIISMLKNANLRFSFSRTVARPNYRERANAPFYDFLQNITYYGNSNLVETHITNYEVRWEHYFENAQYYSLSVFYKQFENPIEQNLFLPGSDSRSVQFVNVPKATDIGFELEVRKSFGFMGKPFENFYAYANFTYIKSKVFVHGVTSDTSSSRPLEGQSPYVLNASLIYTEPKTNFSVATMFNYIGDRLYLVGSVSDPSVWEKVHPTLDLKVSKGFAKNGLIEVTWSDILHQDGILYQDLNSSNNYDSGQGSDYATSDRLDTRQHFGYTLSLAVSYKF